MRRPPIALGLALILAGLIMPGPSAHAATPVIPADQQVAVLTVDPGTVEVFGASAAPDNGVTCWQQHASISGKTVAGVRLFTWHQSEVWCGDGYRIKPDPPRPAFTVNNWPSIPGWSIWTYTGLAFSVHGGGVGQGHVYRRNGGTFRACVLWVCQTRIPWLAFTVRANGTSNVSGGW